MAGQQQFPHVSSEVGPPKRRIFPPRRPQMFHDPHSSRRPRMQPGSAGLMGSAQQRGLRDRPATRHSPGQHLSRRHPKPIGRCSLSTTDLRLGVRRRGPATRPAPLVRFEAFVRRQTWGEWVTGEVRLK
ncbi:MAG: hypothetical protein SYR96_08485 [Actinomycetota bacterium]|nr:hypothetical protein [Actinomycetota bacterium]